MGGALLERWQYSQAASRFDVIDPTRRHGSDTSIHRHEHVDHLPDGYTPDVVVFAVKPQQLDEVLPDYAKRFSAHAPLYISIAAGKTLHYYQSTLGEHSHVVRAMPNTPALIGEGVSVLVGTNALPASAKKNRHRPARRRRPCGMARRRIADG